MSTESRFVLSKKTILITGVIAIVIISGIVTAVVINANKQTTISSQETKDAPEYKTILPNGASIESFSGWTRISPPENDPVYAYKDTVKNVSVTVSEQPIPESFKDNLDTQVSEVAKKYNATAQIDAGGTKAFVGTSAKGPQSVIFAKNNLLILIKSSQKIENKNWVEYIESLSPSVDVPHY